MKSIPYILVIFLFVLSHAFPAQTPKQQRHVQPKDLFLVQEVSGAILLEAEWLELNPIKPLQATRDTQELSLLPNPPIQMVFAKTGNRGLVPADGRDADIEAELIGSDGITYRSAPGRSETMSGSLKITSRILSFKNLPQKITYTKVRIKSSAAYPVEKILWRCYNWAEVHH